MAEKRKRGRPKSDRKRGRPASERIEDESLPLQEFIPIAEAAREIGKSYNAVRLAILEKRVLGGKFGRNWIVTNRILEKKTDASTTRNQGTESSEE